MALQKASGFEFQETLRTIAELSSEAVTHFVADPLGALRAPSKMMDILGVDMVYGIIWSCSSRCRCAVGRLSSSASRS